MNGITLSKIVATTTVFVGGTAGAGFFGHKHGLFQTQYSTPENTQIVDYVIAKTVALNDQENNKQQESPVENKNIQMYEKSFFSFNPKINFFCKLSVQSTKTSECELYKLSDNEKQLGELVKNNYSATNENVKEEGNFFKIKVDETFKDSIYLYGSSEITIEITERFKEDDISKNSGAEHIQKQIEIEKFISSKKTFAKLMPIYRVENGKIIDRNKSILFAKSTAATTVDSLPEIVDDDKSKRNYECQIDEKRKFDCRVKKVNFNATKKVFIFQEWNDKKETKPSGQQLTKNELGKANQYFQIKIKEEDLKMFDFSNNETKINIVEKINDSTTAKKYASLTPEFFVLDEQIFKKEKTLNLFVVNNESSGIADTEWKEKYKTCAFEGQNSNISCSIYKWETGKELSYNSNLFDINFEKKLSPVESDVIEKNKYYVIKLDLTDVEGFKSVFKNQRIILSSSMPNKKTYSFSTLGKVIGKIFTDNPEHVVVFF